MPDFVFPTSTTLRTIAQQKIARLAQDRLGFQLVPMVDVNAANITWEQKDNYSGLQQARGMNGEPTRIIRIGASKFQMDPGVYGEFVVIDEKELTERRRFGDPMQPVNISDLVMEAQDHLLQRRLDRIELIIWTLLTTGTFSVADPNGYIQHTDTFPILTYSAVVPWGTVATATPLADARAIQILGRGQSASFGADARLIMNRTTYNKLIANTNAADLYGRRQSGLATINNLNDYNTLLTGDGLPNIQIYDETYENPKGTVNLFIPNDKVVVIGRRPAGQALAEYQMTRNANNPNMAPGAYTKVIDKGARDDEDPPRNIRVHDGHNGGPAIFFPGAIIVMSV
jgi:hypothetical protein